MRLFAAIIRIFIYYLLLFNIKNTCKNALREYRVCSQFPLIRAE